MDDYFRKVAQNYIQSIHHAIRGREYIRAHDLLEDLSAIFVGRGPGMVENHTEK
jgi:hypothetical protein